MKDIIFIIKYHLSPGKFLSKCKINIFKNYLRLTKLKYKKKLLKDKKYNDYYCSFLEEDFSQSNSEDLLDLKFYLSLFIKSENNNLINPDIIGLKNNVEIRSPFLDYRVINFAASLPHKYKIKNIFNNKGNKFLPKEYLGKIMTKKANKDKRGFGWNFNMNKLIFNNIYKRSIYQF